ncbi:MAG: ABC transporter ATP-binding protein/permease [Oscillospiraceae bacterium]|nr:ABC transporter ATP-binding protein/permease [Oscillospiraceae bacterium]
MNKNSEIFMSIKKLFSPYKINIAVISIAMIITSIGSFLSPWLTMQLIDIGIVGADFSKTLLYVGLIFFVFLIQQLVGFIQYQYYRDISVKIPNDLNRQACKHTLSIRVKYFKERNFSVVMSEIFQDIANISSLTGTQFLTSFVTLFKIIAGIIALILINWQLALIMISTIPSKLIISSILFKKQEAVYKIIMKVQSAFSAWLGDGISGIIEIKMWGLINKRLSRLNEILDDSKKMKSRLMLYGYVDNLIGSALSISFTCILYLYGSLLIAENRMTIGSLVSFIAYSALVFEPITIISYIITQLSSTKPAFERFITFLNTDSETDHPEAIELNTLMDIESISFEQVSLVYEQEKALEQVSFTIYKGEKIAIIGFNGSGKSSIINLLLRFYEPTEGSIKINDNNISSYTFESYRSIWSLMAQNNYLFNDSIENNINITDDLSADEITESCKKSGAYKFICDLQDGFTAPVGYNGTKLSGGEKQKVALARTLARKNTKILLLDEATSSYDYYSEQTFNQEILLSNRYDITLIITHRPEILKTLDRIIYLEKGKLAGIGSFDELYNSSHSFKEMIINTKTEE